MGGSTPADTTQRQITTPFYGDAGTYGQIHDRFNAMNWDPNTGRPLEYQGPRMHDTVFDTGEQSAYDMTMRKATGPNQFAGYAGQQADRLYGLENPAATNVTLNTLNSQFLSDQNPGFQSMVSSIGDAAREQYNMATGDTAGMFSGRGTFGGSRHRNAQGKNDAAFAKALTDQIGQLRYDDYANRLGMQQAAAQQVASRGDAYNLAGADALDYSNADRLLRMGGYRRQSVTDPNLQRDYDHALAAYQHRMNLPMQEAQLMSEVNRGTGGTTVTTAPGASTAQRVGQGLGMADSAYGILFGK